MWSGAVVKEIFLLEFGRGTITLCLHPTYVDIDPYLEDLETLLVTLHIFHLTWSIFRPHYS